MVGAEVRRGSGPGGWYHRKALSRRTTYPRDSLEDVDDFTCDTDSLLLMCSVGKIVGTLSIVVCNFVKSREDQKGSTLVLAGH